MSWATPVTTAVLCEGGMPKSLPYCFVALSQQAPPGLPAGGTGGRISLFAVERAPGLGLSPKF